MPNRAEYAAALEPSPAVELDDASLAARHPDEGDAEALAQLMLDAYRGTIDFDGDETIEDARVEVRGYFRGQPNPALRECSWVYARGDTIVSACLVAHWQARGQPLIAYVMTRADAKGAGLARRLVARSMASLRGAGYAEVRAVITRGNTPSERVFTSLGFAPADGGE